MAHLGILLACTMLACPQNGTCQHAGVDNSHSSGRFGSGRTRKLRGKAPGVATADRSN